MVNGSRAERVDPAEWMDLLLTRILINKLLTWLITLLDKNRLADQNVVLRWISTFHLFFYFLGVWCVTWPTPRVLISSEGRAAVRGEKAREQHKEESATQKSDDEER